MDGGGHVVGQGIKDNAVYAIQVGLLKKSRTPEIQVRRCFLQPLGN